jgi:hypothetical protein
MARHGGNQLIGNNISGAKQTGIAPGSNDLADGNFITNAPSGIVSNDMSSKLKNNTVSQSAVPTPMELNFPERTFS